MLLTVVRVYQQGRKLSEAELRSAEGVVGDVRTHTVLINGKEVHMVDADAAPWGSNSSSRLDIFTIGSCVLRSE